MRQLYRAECHSAQPKLPDVCVVHYVQATLQQCQTLHVTGVIEHVLKDAAVASQQSSCMCRLKTGLHGVVTLVVCYEVVAQCLLFCRQRSNGALLAQGNHVEYSAGGAPYPDSIEEYHKQQSSRQQSSKL